MQEFHPDEGCPGCEGELFPVCFQANTTGNENVEVCTGCGAAVCWRHESHKAYVGLRAWPYGSALGECL